MGNVPCKNLQVLRKRDDDDDDDDDELIDKEIRDQIDAAFDTLQKDENCNSLLKKHLTPDIFDLVKKKTSLYGATLLDVIQSGVRNLDSEVGVYAPDAESYTVFAPLLDRIISEYHGGFTLIDRHPPCNYGDPSEIGNLDTEGRFVLSIRIRCARSIQGYPLNALLTRDQYSGIESRMFTTLGRLQGDVAGDYYPLTIMPDEVRRRLTQDNLLFKEGDRFMQAANGCRDWPMGRGVFSNADRTFVIWVNEADHVRVLSVEQGGDLGAAYERLVDGLTQLEDKVTFSHSSRFGFITFSPTELGTTVRASVRLRLPRLTNETTKLQELANKLRLRIRGTEGEQHEVQGGVVDVRNHETLGLSEFDSVRQVADGVRELIRMEKFS
ncbi:arginine kinase Lit v 2-like [Pollicipes pollicipes]|uniref:arginine kinase Lit v 2-like n=1 Tax=Pollicipes pollicipes TaxID=41117 RepID=UPI001884FBA4|nr:arginine kinase Lit v 2-like [Pollicipes pollicipes]